MIKESKKKPIRPESVLRRMERMMGGAVKGKDQKREAQDLVYDAWEAADSGEEYTLLQSALDLDPTNVDAWLGLMKFVDIDKDERVEMLRKLIAMGEENLGKKIFIQDKGHFWGMLETRPYMRARAQLALYLMDVGQYEESIVEHEGMLALNPNDNQGVRYALMASYLTASRLDDARRLFKNYDECGLSAIWSWAHVLERFLAVDMTGAENALQVARKQNSHAEAYFLEHRKPPKFMPKSYAIGSQEEATIAWDILQHAWKKHPKAQAWLKAQQGKNQS